MELAEDFRQFMACVIKLEDLQKLSSQSLMAFQQHLEVFRREPLSETSDVVAEVVASAPSARLSKYLEAGGWHEYPARAVVVKLDSALKCLRNYVIQGEDLLVELERYVARANDAMQLELCSQLETVEISSLNPESDDIDAHQQLSEPNICARELRTSDYVHMMSLLLSMLVEDSKMQEKIMNELGLETPSEALQTYSLMWTLRPFLDDAVVEQALSWLK